MKPFHTIAVPHEDILKGRLTMDVFAADLWEVAQNRGPDEYKDAETFFKKTFLTHGLENLLDVVKRRIEGNGGDPIIQIQTPFGGGKTHALIAMYHKAEEWSANRVVIVGTALSPQNTLWGIIEEQLSGKIDLCSGQVSPGKETIRKILSAHQPLIILMDEVLEYATKAAGVKVGNSTLAAQSIAFMQELSEAVSTLERVCLVVTLPASLLEHYDEGAERLYQQLQKVSGRVEKIYTPVEENEIASIIRRRLFSRIESNGIKEIVTAFIDYAEKESVLPGDVQASEYKKRFNNSFPFMPEVIEVLYHRWGTFPTFQRTRGVLRLLSLVVHSLKESNKSYISLADFDLGQQELRQELLKHIGAEYNGIISQDITHPESGAQKINNLLGKSYQGLKIGTRTATTMFLYSFSGGQEHGTSLGEIKRSATTMQNPSPLVSEAIEQLKTKLFYLQSRGENYFFSNQANLNRILLNAMENIKDAELVELEKEKLRSSLSGKRFRTYIWEEKSLNISDSEEIKLVILKKNEKSLVNELFKTKGQSPRVNRNTLFMLYPLESERTGFINVLKRKLAYEYILSDHHLRLTDEQRKEIKDELKKIEAPLVEAIRRYYRLMAIADKDGYKERDLGIPTYGLNRSLDEEIYEQLKMDGEILEKIAPLVLKEKYLVGKDFVLTMQLFQSTLKTPGEVRLANRSVLEYGIREGVLKGLFGLGELVEEQLKCVYFKESAPVSFSGHEIIIKAEVCEQQNKEQQKEVPELQQYKKEDEEKSSFVQGGSDINSPQPVPPVKSTEQLILQFDIPKGKVAGIMGVMNLLQSKFNKLEISLSATDGSITKQEIEDKIEEAFRQLNIDFKISD